MSDEKQLASPAALRRWKLAAEKMEVIFYDGNMDKHTKAVHLMRLAVQFDPVPLSLLTNAIDKLKILI